MVIGVKRACKLLTWNVVLLGARFYNMLLSAQRAWQRSNRIISVFHMTGGFPSAYYINRCWSMDLYCLFLNGMD